MISVILPTYNEAGNIGEIVPRISSALQAGGAAFEIIVMDDNSPDGTADAVRALESSYPVKVQVRTGQRGLSAAVIDGFRIAHGDIFVVMDADLSHPPEKLLEMVAPIQAQECDICVGSRYVPGGGCVEWPWYRQVVSRGAGMLAKGITRLSDPTSGFMAVRRSVVDIDGLDPIGWKIVLEVVTRSGSRVREIPIMFADRFKGESKLTAAVQLQYLLHLWRLYDFKLPNMWQFVKFCVVGFSGVFIDTLILVTMVESVGSDPRQAAIVAFFSAVTWNYFLNRWWTFRQPAKGGDDRLGLFNYFAFLVVCLVGLAIRIGIMHLLIEAFGMGTGKRYILASICGIVVATAANFAGSKYLVFRRRAKQAPSN